MLFNTVKDAHLATYTAESMSKHVLMNTSDKDSRVWYFSKHEFKRLDMHSSLHKDCFMHTYRNLAKSAKVYSRAVIDAQMFPKRVTWANGRFCVC